MTGYVIRDASIVLGSYLERTPYDGTYSWLAGTVTYATVFSKEAAEAMAGKLRADGETVIVEPDYCRRAPEITSLDNDCEPGDSDGEDFRGGEAAAYSSEQQATAQKLK